MSRGLGQMQRAVLDVLREDAAFSHHYGTARKGEGGWLGLRHVAKKIAGRDLDPELLNADHSLIESVRRAVKTLEHRGTVEIGYLQYDTHDPDRKWLAEYQGSGLHLRLNSDEWDSAPCQICTIGPCVGPIRGRLLRGSRSAEYACPVDDDPITRLQGALG